MREIVPGVGWQVSGFIGGVPISGLAAQKTRRREESAARG